MALAAGSITINSNGTHSGSGLAYDLFLIDVVGLEAWAGWASYPDASKVTALTPIKTANDARALAIITAVALGEVTVTVSASDAGLQRMPAVTTVDTPCKAPAAPVVLSTKGTIA